jgi:hypothetical protein
VGNTLAYRRVFRAGLLSFRRNLMRNVLFAASAVAALAVPGAASAQYYYQAADVYAPPTVYVAPSPSPYARAPAVVGAPMVESQVYLAPNTAYVAPGTVYDDQAVYMNGQRYYRDCWWDWGRRRCELKPWW